MYDFAVIGGGIVGLATAREILTKHPGASLVILEKESGWARHQSGRNSGVIHSGIYYKPGSLKARLALEGNRSMVEFCAERGIPHEICGKLIVATETEELDRLDALCERGRENGIEVNRIDPEEAREIEPHVRSVGAIHVPSAGIVDFVAVCQALAREVETLGGDLRLSTRVKRITTRDDSTRTIVAGSEEFECRTLIACAGLHSDRMAKRDGTTSGARVVPFRGEYYELSEKTRHYVNGMVYPVPDPRFPFLGVHLTRAIDGSVHAGPNAVLALSREGYSWTRIRLGDLFDIATWPGFWKLASRHWKEGADEIARSLNKDRFALSLQKLIPRIGIDDLRPAQSGVRAQSITRQGDIVDDFLIVRNKGALHVCNAPSPAATASLEIAKEIVAML